METKTLTRRELLKEIERLFGKPTSYYNYLGYIPEKSAQKSNYYRSNLDQYGDMEDLELQKILELYEENQKLTSKNTELETTIKTLKKM